MIKLVYGASKDDTNEVHLYASETGIPSTDDERVQYEPEYDPEKYISFYTKSAVNGFRTLCANNSRSQVYTEDSDEMLAYAYELDVVNNTPIPSPHECTVTFAAETGCTLTVTADGTPLISGDIVLSGSYITVTNTISIEGKSPAIKINGEIVKSTISDKTAAYSFLLKDTVDILGLATEPVTDYTITSSRSLNDMAGDLVITANGSPVELGSAVPANSNIKIVYTAWQNGTPYIKLNDEIAPATISGLTATYEFTLDDNYVIDCNFVLAQNTLLFGAIINGELIPKIMKPFTAEFYESGIEINDLEAQDGDYIYFCTPVTCRIMQGGTDADFELISTHYVYGNQTFYEYKSIYPTYPGKYDFEIRTTT